MVHHMTRGTVRLFPVPVNYNIIKSLKLLLISLVSLQWILPSCTVYGLFAVTRVIVHFRIFTSSCANLHY